MPVMMATRKRVVQGSILLIPLNESEHAYVQYVGIGLDGETFRVLPGRYTTTLTKRELEELATEEESFIAQSWLSALKKLEGADVVHHVESHPIEELAPFWVMSPRNDEPDRQWILTLEGSGEKRLEFEQRRPDVDISNIPEGSILSVSGFVKRLVSGWQPRFGDFWRWQSSLGAGDTKPSHD
jgi:hypothetical protein